MIQQKKKPCKGNFRSNHFKGCGEITYAFKFGLCKACFSEWVYSTGEGAEFLRKQVIPQAKKEVQRKERQKVKKAYEKLETKTDVEKKLQTEINSIVRLIDKGHPCISSGRPLGKNYDAGHFFAVGGNPQIRFHLFNIYAQSVEQNQHRSGNPLGFIEGLENTFGSDFKDACISLKGLPALNLSKEELREKTAIARGIVKWLKLQDREFTTRERLELRERFQEELNIYDTKSYVNKFRVF